MDSIFQSAMTTCDFAIHPKNLIPHFKQKDVRIHGSTHSSKMITSLLLCFIGQKVNLKAKAHADYFALGNFPPHIAIDPNKPVKWECEVKQKDKAISLLKKNLQQI